MAVAHDALSQPGNPIGSVSPSWTHNPVGTPRGVVVRIVQDVSTTDAVTGVTYGGVAMTRLPGADGFRTLGTGETGAVYLYFLGSTIPTGSQTVAATLSGPATVSRAYICSTVTAAGDTEVDVSNSAAPGLTSNPSLTVNTTSGRGTVIYYALFSGLGSVITTAESGSTHEDGVDFGLQTALFARKAHSGGSTTIGYTASSDDVCHAAIAIGEVLITTVEPTSVGSAEAVPSPTIAKSNTVAPSGVTPGEAVGTPTIMVGDPVIAPGSVGSGEAVGQPTVTGHGYVGPASIDSEEEFGSLTVLSPRKIIPVGIESADQPGTPAVNQPTVAKSKLIRLNPGHRGIPSAEAVGTPTLTPGSVKPTAIDSGEAFGTPHLIIPQFVEPTGIPSGEEVGTPSVARPGTIIPPSIASSEAVGSPAIVRAGSISPTGIASLEVVGEPTLLTPDQLVEPEGAVSAEAVGTPTIVRAPTHVIVPTSIASLETFGSPVVSLGPNAPILPGSIISRERFGLPRIIVGIPAGPVGQAPGRIPNRLYDPETGVAFAFAINHSDEDPRGFERTYEAGAPTTVGLSRQQSAPDPMRLSFRGTIMDPAQVTALDGLFDHCDAHTLIYEDYSGEAYEVIITTWDCRPERARNPITRGLVMWRYTMDLAILRVLSGALDNTIGNPPATPPDIVVEAPALAKQPVGIASKAAVGAPTLIGGSLVLAPSGAPASGGLGLVVVTGGTAPGGGGPGPGGGGSIPAAFPSRLRASGTRVVDANEFVMARMTGENIHCLPTYIPSQQDLHDIKAQGGSWVRVVLTWSNLEPTQGVFNATMRSQLDILLTRLATAGLYAELELHLNVGAVPGWTSGVDETAKYANGGQFITQALAQRYGTNKVVFGFGLNEIPLGSDVIRNGNNSIPYLEGVQSTMIDWFRDFAPDWIGVVTLGYSNQTPYPDAPRTPASPTAFDAVGGNVIYDVHHYQAGVNSNDPSYDGRQPNGHIWPTYQGGPAYWQVSDYPLAYVDTAVHRAQIAAFLADYVTFSHAAQKPVMVGEVGWAANNTGGKAAWWAALRAALAAADPAMAAHWIYSTRVPPGEYWPARPNGTWDVDVQSFLSGVW